MKPGRTARALTVLAAAVLVGFPLAELVRASVAGPPGTSAGAAWGSLADGAVVTGILHSVVVSVLATVVAVGFGAAMALLVQRSDLPGRRLLGGLFLAPLVIPPYVAGLSWLEAYGGAGLIRQWTGLSFGWVTGPVGVTVLLAIQGCPVVYLLVGGVLAGQRSLDLEEAARSSGATPFRVLREITFPLLRPALLGAALLVFVASASDFGVPAILGIPAGFSTITTAIYSDLSFAAGANAIGSATALSTLLGVLTLALLVPLARYLGESNPLSGGFATPLRARAEEPGGQSGGLVILGRAASPTAAICWVLVALTTAFPLVALVLEAVGNGFQLDLWPGHWHAAAFVEALTGSNLAALARSVVLAGGAAAIVTVGGAAAAYVIRRAGRPMRLVGAAIALPFALPGSVVALAVLLAWERWLYGSLLIILIAYVARFAVIGVRSADSGLASLGDELVEAGRAAGARSGRVLREVVLPTLGSSLWASFGLVFLLAIHELTMSSLLYGPSTATFAVTVLDAEQAGQLSLTAALALVVTGITLAGAIALARLRRRMLRAGPPGRRSAAPAGELAPALDLVSSA